MIDEKAIAGLVALVKTAEIMGKTFDMPTHRAFEFMLRTAAAGQASETTELLNMKASKQ